MNFHVFRLLRAHMILLSNQLITPAVSWIVFWAEEIRFSWLQLRSVIIRIILRFLVPNLKMPLWLIKLGLTSWNTAGETFLLLIIFIKYSSGALFLAVRDTQPRRHILSRVTEAWLWTAILLIVLLPPRSILQLQKIFRNILFTPTDAVVTLL